MPLEVFEATENCCAGTTAKLHRQGARRNVVMSLICCRRYWLVSAVFSYSSPFPQSGEEELTGVFEIDFTLQREIPHLRTWLLTWPEPSQQSIQLLGVSK